MGKATILLVLGMSAIMSNMLMTVNERQLPLVVEVSDHYEAIISRNIANSAANIAVSKLYRNFSWKTGFDSTDLSGGDYKVELRDVNFDTTFTVRRVKLMAISNFAGRSDTVIVVMAQPPFSNYASFNSSWPTNLYYGTGDTLWGPVHTNQKFGFAGYPVFYGKVTSVAPNYKTLGPTDPQFLGGHQFGVDPIPLPDMSTGIGDLSSAAQNGGEVHNDNVWIKFKSNGTYQYRYGGYPANESNPNEWDGTSTLSDFNGTLMTNDGGGYDIHVKGVISGQLTILSDRDIYIEDDIVYANDPRSDPASGDMLGLVAKNNVIVVDNLANQTDVEIHGAIVALNQSFMVENYSAGGPRGTLTTFGSVVQDLAAPYGTGTMSGEVWVITNGYQEKSIYDGRFLNIGPPVFPIVQKVSLYSWQEDAGIEDYNHDILMPATTQ
ncbi:MAG: hypothetical protein O7G31_14745 [Calditrichaeota bacterium]|nr:hypothetical protein [Calditrichota bacterium]